MPKNKFKVLVVDDEKIVRDFFYNLLTFLGIEVVCAPDGYHGIKFCRNIQFDALFIDMRMPGIDGLETYRQIHRILPCAVIVMMTGFAQKDMLMQTQKEGAYTVIHKPFSIAEIKNIIDKLVPAPEEKKLNIMVIDDDHAVLGFFSKLLENKKQRHKVVDNGDEALRAMKEEKFDLVFLDLVLKDIDGAQVYKSIREISPDTAVIIITAYPQKAEKLAGKVEGCIAKPFEIGNILEYIEKVKAK